ncbi:MAG: T9SS type A sorting domain-containing protein [Cyclobacteriaceae bacterium]
MKLNQLFRAFAIASVLLITLAASSGYAQSGNVSRWGKAGVSGAISRGSRGATVTSKNSSGINAAIKKCPAGKHVYLPNGSYTINSRINMKKGVVLVGESRTGVKCKISMTSGTAFLFEGVSRAGIMNMTIQGTWGTPTKKWNDGNGTTPSQSGNTNTSVKISTNSNNCWLDKVTILNSGNHPLLVLGNHNTIRNSKVDGVHRKGGGYQGYFHVGGPDNLIINNTVTHLRHFSIQNPTAVFNVVYDNKFIQEISFHHDDGGNNLIERNTVTLPSDMPSSNPDYYAIMGPWSSQHKISRKKNYLYKNKCKENNHDGATPWSNNSKVYNGPFEVKPDDPSKNFKPMSSSAVPSSGTFYKPTTTSALALLNPNRKPTASRNTTTGGNGNKRRQQTRKKSGNNNSAFRHGAAVVASSVDLNDNNAYTGPLYEDTDSTEPFEFDLDRLTPGQYTFKISDLDENNNVLEEVAYDFEVYHETNPTSSINLSVTQSGSDYIASFTAKNSTYQYLAIKINGVWKQQFTPNSAQYTYNAGNLSPGSEIYVYGKKSGGNWDYGRNYIVSGSGGSSSDAVSISSPSNGANLGSDFTVNTNASGTYEYLVVKVDGMRLTELDDSSSPYSFSLGGLSDGSHTIQVNGKRLDGTWVEGNTITVNVSGADSGGGSTGTNSVSISSPSNGATVGMSFMVNANVSGDYQKVIIKVDGVRLNELDDSSSPYSFDITGLASGTHTLQSNGQLTDGTWVEGSEIFVVVSDASTGGGALTNRTINAQDITNGVVPNSTGHNTTVQYGNGNWISTVALPNSGYNGDIVTFVSSATWSSTIESVRTNMSSNLTLATGDSHVFTYTAGQWRTGSGNTSSGGNYVTISNPSNGANVNSSFTVSTSTSGDYQKVIIKVDGTRINELDDASSPYYFDISGLADGSHTLQANGQLTDGTWVNGNEITVNVSSGSSSGGGGSTSPVTIYSGCNYSGTAIALGVGEYNYGQSGIVNDDISSIKVSDGYQITVYQHGSFAGFTKTWTVDKSCLTGVAGGRTSGDWDNDISSFKIESTSGTGGGSGTNSVAISSPSNGATVNSSFTVSTNASGDYQKVIIKVDGARLNDLDDASSPYSFAVSGLTSGSHTLQANGQLQDGTWVNGNEITVNVSGGSSGGGGSASAVTVYSGCNYSGTAIALGVGNYEYGQSGIVNDDISSIKVSDGYQITVYQHGSFAGFSKTWTVDKSCLTGVAGGRTSGDWDNDISSFKIESTSSTGGDDTSGGDTGSGGGSTGGSADLHNDPFNNSNWSSGYELGNSNFVSYMSSGGYNGSGCIRIKVAQGNHYGASIKKSINRKEAYAQYKVYYESSFTDYNGKGPGWDGTRGVCGWGNCVSTGTNGWSARGSLNADASSGVPNRYYVYHKNMSLSNGKTWGDTWAWAGSGSTMNHNQWYTVDQYIKVNDPGSSNGILRAWVNGNLVYEKTNIRFTTTSNNGFDKVDKYWINYYHGGSATSPRDAYVRIDDFKLSTSPIGASTTGGGSVGGGSGGSGSGSTNGTTSISSPSNGASVGSSFNVVATVASGYKVSVKVDGVWKAGRSDNSGSVALSGIASGSRLIEVYGTKTNSDGSKSYSPTASITVNVGSGGSSGGGGSSNGGTTISSPSNGASVGSSFNVVASVSSGYKVSVKVDGTWKAGLSGNSGTVALSGIASGSRLIEVYGTKTNSDGSKSYSPTASITVNVGSGGSSGGSSGGGVTLSGNAYQSGAGIKGTATISGGSVQYVAMKINGVWKAQDASSPYEIKVDLNNGTYQVELYAKKLDGTFTNTYTKSVTVNYTGGSTGGSSGGSGSGATVSGNAYQSGPNIKGVATVSGGSVQYIAMKINGVWKAQDASSPYEIKVPVNNGTYKVELYGKNPDGSFTNTYTKNVTVNYSGRISNEEEVELDELEEDYLTSANIYPNPIELGRPLNIDFTSNEADERLRVAVINLSGQEVFTGEFITQKGENQLTLETEDLMRGFYMIKLIGSDHESMFRIIIK